MHRSTLEIVGDDPNVVIKDNVLKIDFLQGSNGQASAIIKDYCRPAKRTSEGFLVFEAIATLAGVFEYTDPATGLIRREFRPPWELFYGESMQTVSGIPLTDDHPSVKDIVKPDNWATYTRGTIFPGVTQEDEIYAKVSGVCYDENLIKKIESGQVQLSSGLLSRDVEKPGVWRGQPYDVIQTDLVWNHLASVPRGRMGERAALRLDSADSSLHNPVAIPQGRVSLWKGADLDQPKKEKANMSKVKVEMEGQEIEVPSETGFEIMKARAKAAANQLASLKTDSVDPAELSKMITDAVTEYMKNNEDEDPEDLEKPEADVEIVEDEDPEQVIEKTEDADLEKEIEMLKGENAMLRAMLEEKGIATEDSESAPKMDSAELAERKQVIEEISGLKLDSIDLSDALTASADGLRKMAVTAFIESKGLSVSVPESAAELKGMYRVLLRDYSKQEAEKGSRVVADAFQRQPQTDGQQNKPKSAAELMAEAQRKQAAMYEKRETN